MSRATTAGNRARMPPCAVHMLSGSRSLALLAGPRPDGSAGRPFDLLIKNARVVDGTGSPWYRADLGIKGDTIAAIAPRLDGAGRPHARCIERDRHARLHRHPHPRASRPRHDAHRRQLRPARRDDGLRRAGRLLAAAARAVSRRSRQAARSRSTSAAWSARDRSGRPSSATRTARRPPKRSSRCRRSSSKA